MSCLLKYRLYLLQHDKQFWFLVAILAMATIPINQSTPVLYQEFGNGFFVRTLGMSSENALFPDYILLQCTLSHGAMGAFVGAVMASVYICPDLQDIRQLPLLSAGHSKRDIIRSQIVTVLGPTILIWVMGQGLNLLIQWDGVTVLGQWKPWLVPAMVCLRAILLLGNWSILLLTAYAFQNRWLILLLGTLPLASEIISPHGMLPLPTGILSGVFCGTINQNILGLALTVSIAAFLLLLLWIPIWLERHRK